MYRTVISKTKEWSDEAAYPIRQGVEIGGVEIGSGHANYLILNILRWGRATLSNWEKRGMNNSTKARKRGTGMH